MQSPKESYLKKSGVKFLTNCKISSYTYIPWRLEGLSGAENENLKLFTGYRIK